MPVRGVPTASARRPRIGLPPPPSRTAVVEVPAVPDWNAGMKKAELLSIAQSLGLAVSEDNTKAEIVAALEALG